MPTKSNNTGGRGGARPGAGRKKSAVKDKAENGNPGGRKLEVLDIPEVEGAAMPKPHDFLSAEQRDGSVLQAQEIYTETWQWLKDIGCAAKVSPQLLERYAKYYWLYRVKFGIPATNLATKGDSITFSTPTIEGTILRRNKADAGGKHPWKAEALEGDVTAATITNWYKEVYEPTYTTTPEKQG